MKEWHENNFLEKLAPLLREHRCPGEEALSALARGGMVAQPEPIARHLANCPACRDLLERLARFGQVGTGEDETKWTAARPRVLKAIENFSAERGYLQKKSGSRAAIVEQDRKATRSSWRPIWLWAPALALTTCLVIAFTIYRPISFPENTEVASSHTTKAESSRSEDHGGDNEAPTRGATRSSTDASSDERRGEHSEQPVNAVKTDGSRTGVNPAAEKYLGQRPNPVDIASPNQDATANVRQESGSPDVSSGSPAQTALSENFLRVDSQRPFWIRITSRTQQPNNAFDFTAVVTDNLGNDTLQRGTTLSGSGTLIQGRTNLQITFLVRNQVRYVAQNETAGSAYIISNSDNNTYEVTPSTTLIFEHIR